MTKKAEAISAAGRPYAFTYHARLSGALYGVLLYTKDEPGPDTRGLQRGNRHIITDDDWKAWQLHQFAGGKTRMIDFFTKRFPPPADPDETPLTAAKTEAIEVVQDIIEAEFKEVKEST